MKKLGLVLALALASADVSAMSAVTKDGYLGCLKKEWLDDVISFVVAKDMDSVKAYVASQKCISMKPGMRVTVTESPGMFGGTAGFVFQGLKMWTVREALDYGK